ncbi:MAG: manganese efflux pump [Chloroflexi bacterium]|nr:manganese efflux pump [Chloroflexota bacterium]MBT7080883.1 manganese efflux pump [Chloroflexota bacterium]MBT7290781.1 manganese efflux pump [Chloroflexota bacterium]
MDLLSILIIAVGLAVDCFAVSVSGSISMKKVARLPMLRMALAFGLFQAGMTALGWLVGQTVVDYIASVDHWIAFGLLALVGAKMIWESIHADSDNAKTVDVTKGLALLVLSIATSIDALAVGVSFAVLDVNIAFACALIGTAALTLTIIGLILGKRLGTDFGKRAEIVGGIVLIGIGTRILISHLF